MTGEPAASVLANDDVSLRIEGVCKRFGHVPAVDNVSVAVRKGEFFSLLGPSGCGKTTLMRMIAGFEMPDSGQILLDGKDLGAQPPHLRPVNMMFQSYALFPHMDVRDNIAFGLKQMRMGSTAISRRVAEMVALTQLEGLEHRRPDALSGGQKQRVALARALARAPKVLLLDEPLAALDRKLRKDTQSELKRIQSETGATFIVVTHDQEEAMALSDRMAVMHKGRIAQIGTPTEIYSAPVNGFVASFLGEINLVPARRLAHGQWQIDGLEAVLEFPSAAFASTDPAFLALRPEQLQLAREARADATGWQAQVRARTLLGPAVSVDCMTPQGLALNVLVPASDPSAHCGVGDAVFIAFKPAEVRIIGG